MTLDKDDGYDKTIVRADWLKALNISPNKFSKLIKDGEIPKPLPFGERCHRWPYSDLIDVLSRFNNKQ
jgi:predicted DNA-binding transcriptional regulator AlpA